MNKILNSKWFYALISLVLAVGLFLFVNTTQSGSNGGNTEGNPKVTSLSATERKTVAVQLRLNVDSDKYFVTGYPANVKVNLSGPAALVTATANTQNFRVFADLTSLKAGQHIVKLQQDGLNKALKYSIAPESISVNIQPRQTVSFPVELKFDPSRIAANYQAGKGTTTVTSVKATGAKSEIDKIDRVVAQINLGQNTKATVNTQAVIEALDKNGRTVNVILTPSTTQASLPITAKGRSKRVSLAFKATGGSKDREYKLSSQTKTVRIFGTESQLAKIKRIVATVDVSDVKNKLKKTISLDPRSHRVKGIDPERIQVQISAKSN